MQPGGVPRTTLHAFREMKITRMVNSMPKPETANTCGQCEYFDHGLADKATGHSDCLNRNSDRFQAYVSSAACNAFYPGTSNDTERFEDSDMGAR